MGTPYLSEIRVFAFNFAPKGWALCNGQTLPINQNQALFSLMGTTYGGNGTTTFQLPNLQGQCAMHVGNGFVQGETAGEATHTVIPSELPVHSHPPVGSSAVGTQTSPVGNYPAASIANSYSLSSPDTTLGSGSNAVGGSQPHENRSPFLVLNICIALTGIFPSRN